MTDDLPDRPEYRDTMQRLEGLRRTNDRGSEYWLARDIQGVLGYSEWRNFEGLIDRAMSALRGNGVDPSHHVVGTNRMMGFGKSAKRDVREFYLSRAASYLIAMNGDPAKPEIAAAQAYFAVQTRRAELADQVDDLSEDQKRIELRSKVAESFKRVSGVAQEAGVSSRMQAIFHDARYHGLYGMGGRDVKRLKGLRDNDNIFDRAGPLELSANDFQMNLAADVIKSENIRGEQRVINTNKEVGAKVRKAMIDSNATPPEKLALEQPIKEVRKRLKAQAKLRPTSPTG